jgi:hypothetical protein
MNINHQKEIFRRYPNLYRAPGEDSVRPIDERGIECGDAWFAQVDELSCACEAEIQSLIGKGISAKHWPRIAQVKEKLGGLRFYVVGNLSYELRDRILKVEQASSF